MATSLGTSVNLLVNGNIFSANHLAATQTTHACRHGQEIQTSEWERYVI